MYQSTNSLFACAEELWTPYIGDSNVLELIYQGRVFQKNSKRKWDECHLELYFDKLIRVLNGQKEICNINGCFLKKIKYGEASFQPYKYGFRLLYNKQRCEFFTQTAEQFNRWQMMLKRYCLLTKFYKKYKLLGKQKLQELYPSQSYKAIRQVDGLYFQVRIIEKSLIEDKSLLMNEISLLRRFDHIYVQKIQEVYEDQQFLYVIYDQYAGKEQRYMLQQLLSSNEKVIAECFYKLLLGLQHIHSKGAFHRDIKFDNVFNRFPEIISDGCIVNFVSGDIVDNKFHKRIGTPGFMAPEIFRTKQYDQKVDIFSVGVMLYYVVFGKMPFGNEFHEIIKKNEVGDIEYPPFCRISTSGLELMKCMLHKDPNKRLNAFQALNHHWFINLRLRDLLGRGQVSQQNGIQNLSTILEKSDINDTSLSNKRTLRASRSKSSTEIGILDQEFIYDSVDQKMKNLQSLIKCPSRH